MTSLDLQAAASAFALEMQDLLTAVLPGHHRVAAFQAEQGNRFVIRPDNDGQTPGHVALLARGDPIATLRISCLCTYDSAGSYLAVDKSEFALHVDEIRHEPLLRLEYLRDMHTDPSCHWQVHGENGPLAIVRYRAGAKKASRLASLHLPVGGARMRPCLEDLLELLVRDCSIDANPAWAIAVGDGRERWRRMQVGALVRDAPAEAVRVLRELGYAVNEPENLRQANTSRLRGY